MQSTYLSRSPFGCTRISFVTAVLFFGTLSFAGNAGLRKSQQVRKGGRLNRLVWQTTRGFPRLCVS